MYNVETYMDLYWTSTCRPIRLTSKQMALRRLQTTRLVVGLQEYEGIFLYPLTVVLDGTAVQDEPTLRVDGAWRQCTTRRRRYIVILMIVTNVGYASRRLRNSDFAEDLTPTLGLITHKTTRDVPWDYCQVRLSWTEAVLWGFVRESLSLEACMLKPQRDAHSV